jgi:metallo-beta-lactamase family protein
VKKIKFFGAAGEVTGSAFMLSDDILNQDILVDLGMFQGPGDLEDWNYKRLQFNPQTLTGVILTHAHLDHCGRIPLLTKGGYTGPIYMTRATRALMEIVLLDSAKINRLNKEHEPLYTDDHVGQVLAQVEIHEYGEKFMVGKYQATFHDAGHILGSAFVELVDPVAEDGIKKIIFSGDLGNSPEDIVKPTEIIHSADIVVMESTYGNKLHEKENKMEILRHEINEIEKNQGVLLIPSFSIDRTQMILHIIDHLKKNKQVKSETPVFLDSPMAIRVTNVYEHYRNLYGQEMAAHAKMDDPFVFPGLTISNRTEDSHRAGDTPPPKVIIAGNGMMEGGRILQHAAKYLPKTTTRLLIVGYQAEETRGRAIQEGAKSINIDRQDIMINATISEAHSMSAHADQNQLMAWLKNINGVKQVYLVHGEDDARAELKQKIQTDLGVSGVFTPGMDEELSLQE